MNNGPKKQWDKSKRSTFPRNQLRNIRIARGYTLPEIANLLGVKRSLIQDIEIGRQRINVDFLLHFCSVMSVSADRILFGSKQ